MSPSGGRPVRIAHAHGNRRELIEATLAAEVDFIEADLWHRAGDVWARHERRLGPIPLLYDRKPRGISDYGPWALTVFPNHYIRPDLHPLSLRELLEGTKGKRRLLLDLKDDHEPERARGYAQTLLRIIADAGCEETVAVCGQTDVLDAVREVAPRLDVRYSIERQGQWDAFLRRLDADPGLRGVCLYHRFLGPDVERVLAERGLEIYCWTVDDSEEARRLVERGVDGIISNSLPLLERL